jgi:hypothetical protein
MCFTNRELVQAEKAITTLAKLMGSTPNTIISVLSNGVETYDDFIPVKARILIDEMEQTF